jgi:hypothetical protein
MIGERPRQLEKQRPAISDILLSIPRETEAAVPVLDRLVVTIEQGLESGTLKLGDVVGEIGCTLQNTPSHHAWTGGIYLLKNIEGKPSYFPGSGEFVDEKLDAIGLTDIEPQVKTLLVRWLSSSMRREAGEGPNWKGNEISKLALDYFRNNDEFWIDMVDLCRWSQTHYSSDIPPTVAFPRLHEVADNYYLSPLSSLATQESQTLGGLMEMTYEESSESQREIYRKKLVHALETKLGEKNQSTGWGRFSSPDREFLNRVIDPCSKTVFIGGGCIQPYDVTGQLGLRGHNTHLCFDLAFDSPTTPPRRMVQCFSDDQASGSANIYHCPGLYRDIRFLRADVTESLPNSIRGDGRFTTQVRNNFNRWRAGLVVETNVAVPHYRGTEQFEIIRNDIRCLDPAHGSVLWTAGGYTEAPYMLYGLIARINDNGGLDIIRVSRNTSPLEFQRIELPEDIQQLRSLKP